MTQSQEKITFLKALFSKRMLVMLALGFSSGLPFLVTKDIVKAWLTDSKIDLATIGFFSALSIPYTFKFLWSPLVDRFSLLPKLGRRRSWMLVSQVLLLLTIGLMGTANPTNRLQMLSIFALTIAFFAASQDIVLDAFRREYLSDEELGLGTGVWVNAYRGANLASVGIAFALADTLSYPVIFWIIGSMMGVGVVATLWVDEPSSALAPRSFRAAVVDPFKEFFSRRSAFWVLAFILLYKIGDNMAAAMNVPFILQMGYEKKEYFLIVKGGGMAALFAGMFVGGIMMIRLGFVRSLVFFGILQLISTACFGFLATTGKSLPLLTAVVVFELFTGGMGTTAYTAFIAMQTNRKFTATQYALMSSLMAVPGTIVASFTGVLALKVGWTNFYGICAVAAVPGLFIIGKIKSSLDERSY